jgi:hypothetical protein
MQFFLVQNDFHIDICIFWSIRVKNIWVSDVLTKDIFNRSLIWLFLFHSFIYSYIVLLFDKQVHG